ncbi:hypothetical protein M758_7G031800 [Ceratodon purpureus]|uniref:Glycosyltransferase n=2 Tax=Ceratodon purpureus TaxID=3225 RepID=A0A8T0H6M3_CERPU|nr:hypothetical protein KC19_7G033200 [Ceratodon purpureus]KAG0566035.1 hypothetical protein KC19_7G033200 [Ceratodon purpureus]KAG0566037.1 hypothetical protein KC19_7G033200 [Ceratodon purpureus]KAG0610008.1 hypothetical protein M758_7G031800 [Ceratodon purpureus]KAG0610009.1 hypothetical protein M758_7G031800 [Ceratodon purpureus]
MGSKGNQSSSPHVIMIGSPVVSHCVPALLFVRKLNALGINVTFINAESIITKLEAIEAGLLGGENGRLRVVVLPNGEGYTPNDNVLVLTGKAEERTSGYTKDCVKGLMESSQDWAPPCCALLDTFADWALKITKPLMPSYIMWTAGAAPLSMLLQAPVLKAQGIIPMKASEAEKLKPVEFPCIPPLHPLDFIDTILEPGPGHDRLLVLSNNILELASGVLVNTVYELESSVFDALNKHYQVGAPSSKFESILSVGPLLPLSVNTKEESAGGVALKRDPVLEWLGKQPHASVLYISFGSVSTLSASQLIELGLGLEASEQRFIWVVRPPHDLSPEGKSELHQYLPPGFTDRIKDRGVIVTGWAPQVQILEHPATGGFFTHCGWSSVIESISGNVPMLAWPIQAEQRMNSSWLVDVAGAALKVRKGFEDFATREQVEDAVRLLMCKDKGQALRSNVSRLYELLHKGAAESGSTSRNIKAFTEKLHRWNDRAYSA